MHKAQQMQDMDRINSKPRDVYDVLSDVIRAIPGAEQRTGGNKGMTEKAKEARRAYKREWNRKNRDKVKAAQERYWNRKAQEAANQERADVIREANA